MNMKLKGVLLKIAEIRYLDIVFATIISIMLFIDYWNFTYLQYFGLLIFIIGLIIWILGRIHIGKSYSVIPEAKKLITTGIYSKITHPIYVGSVLFFGGMAIFTLDLYIIIFAVLLFILQIRRARVEEKVLIKNFGSKYLKYKKQTWF